MRISVKSIILVFLMLALSLSVATNSLNGEVETATFEEIVEPLNVILPLNQTNTLGFQQGSIYTDTTLSSGKYHSCAILDNGSVACWGSGQWGQLGNGGMFVSDRQTPTLTSSLGIGRTAVSVSSGSYHTCAILDNGLISCWGDSFGGNNRPTLTGSLGEGRTAVALSSGGEHTCAILDNGAVSCWGRGDSMQVGHLALNRVENPTLVQNLGTGRTAVAISSGFKHTCAILDNGSVSCWGYGVSGSLGNNRTSTREPPALTSSLGVGRTAVAISSGFYHTCAILDNGSISCWGRGYYGQLGSGGEWGAEDQLTPFLTSSLGTNRTAVTISSSPGSEHTCAILDNGAVSCWGYGDDGQLGNGDYSPRYNPTLTNSLGTGLTAVGLSLGSTHTCAILDSGSITCWGTGDKGQLGNMRSELLSPSDRNSLGEMENPRSAGLSERDFDGDGVMNIFEPVPPTLITCSAGQYGRYLCVDAPVGKFTSASSAKYATDCPTGTYQPLTGQSSCNEADAGNYVDYSLGEGQTTQTPCAVGTYNPNSGSISSSACLASDVGHYVPDSGSPNQTACPLKTSTINISSKSIDDCILDTDSDSIPNTIDLDDDGDNYSDFDEIECGSNDTDANSLPDDLDQDFLCDEVDSDIDGDGYEIDSFPYDVNEWNDTDDDGFGDNSDACPNNFGTSIQDRSGCIDTDSDGISDLNDQYPFDASKGGIEDDTSEGNVESKSSSADSVKLVLVTISVTLLVIISVMGVIFIRKRNSDEDEEEDEEEDEYEVEEEDEEESEYSDEPNYSLRGEINDDGWEVLEYPSGSGRWWWKDQENHCWQSWD
tara:strand:- start:747 stop:3221 length:2475 start_codon:yes stop_codon:yes gene_type:complete